MKYAILTIVILITLFVLMIIAMKRMANKSNISKEVLTFTSTSQKAIKNNNKNPLFEVSLLDYKKAKSKIYKTTIGDYVTFKTTSNKKIKVYSNQIYIGLIPPINYKNFSLIATYPEYFEGYIVAKPEYNNTLKRVTINIQAKMEFSQEIFKIDSTYLNKLVYLETAFEVDEIIETNYGTAKIIGIKKDHLIVDVPSLGKREIYDLNQVTKK